MRSHERDLPDSPSHRHGRVGSALRGSRRAGRRDMASAPSAAALSSVLRCRGKLLARQQAAAYSPGLGRGARPEQEGRRRVALRWDPFTRPRPAGRFATSGAPPPGSVGDILETWLPGVLRVTVRRVHAGPSWAAGTFSPASCPKGGAETRNEPRRGRESPDVPSEQKTARRRHRLLIARSRH